MGCFLWREFYRTQEEVDVCSSFDFIESNESLVMYCDASNMGLGGVLMQNGHVMHYAYRQLRIHERN